MGVLTEDLTRLRNEILALRSSRQRETDDRRVDVSRMLADSSKALSAVARATKADRLACISDLRGTVADILSGVRTDLGGARQAWLGLTTPSHRAGEKFESQTRSGASANSKGRRSETGGKRPLVLVGGERPARKKRKH